VLDALEVFRARGATLVDIDLAHARFGIPVYYVIATAEASSNLARYDGVRFGFRAEGTAARGDRTSIQAMYEETRAAGFGAEVKRRIMLGTYVLSAGYYEAFYVKAQQVRTLIRQDFYQVFMKVDVVAMRPVPRRLQTGERVQTRPDGYGRRPDRGLLAGLLAISITGGSPRIACRSAAVGGAPDEATLLRPRMPSSGTSYRRQNRRQPTPDQTRQHQPPSLVRASRANGAATPATAGLFMKARIVRPSGFDSGPILGPSLRTRPGDVLSTARSAVSKPAAARNARLPARDERTRSVRE
jgi:hypothetical protein